MLLRYQMKAFDLDTRFARVSANGGHRQRRRTGGRRCARPPSGRGGAIRIGISGWRYGGWRGIFYPAGLPHRCELAFASRAFDTIEINGSLYSLRFFGMLPRDTAEALALARHRDPACTAARAWRSTGGGRCGMPSRCATRASSVLFCPAFVAQLRHHGVALVFADSARKWPYAEDVTADFVYLRLHGATELYASGYGDAALARWAARIAAWAHGAEPVDARRVASGSPSP
ncbi:MAG TPA: DUF72 domain-containing protein [Candidatus Limnocylindria bacterium]|nr:DUF72 domain-containing protein [Candidatus Limnocylindria bacterium]